MKARLVTGAVRALATTWRVRELGAEHVRRARGQGPVLFAPWHDALIPLVWHHRHQGITLLVGPHADAELLAHAASRWGYGLARGSSSRGGAGGLRALLRALGRGNDGAITPDGPRGPRRTVKPGILRAAQRAGIPVIPVVAHASRGWRLPSWDRMLVPGPSARVTIRYGPAIRVAPEADVRTTPRRDLQSALDALTW